LEEYILILGDLIFVVSIWDMVKEITFPLVDTECGIQQDMTGSSPEQLGPT